jgi:hypothetical protein
MSAQRTNGKANRMKGPCAGNSGRWRCAHAAGAWTAPWPHNFGKTLVLRALRRATIVKLDNNPAEPIRKSPHARIRKSDFFSALFC